MQLEDESLRLLALYLEENPELRSLAIAENYFTDDGLAQLIHALRGNTHLNHLNVLGCTGITDQSLRALEEMVTEVNMSLYALELETEGFDPELVASILSQASMNRAIQEHLKPVKIPKDGQIEIKFDDNAVIARHFDSAIKAWRILGPTVIRAQNEDLHDEHVEKLCAFLSGRNLIQSLNLRRNKIGDRGAIAIAEYVRKADKTLTSLELERNQIQDAGGEALLKAMQANMRMERCQMTYGNPLRPEICRQIEREIKANVQIKASVVPAYKAAGRSLTHYAESDRGPDFVRCALKSCELFKILHLSLPDNMIGRWEMRDIALVLSRNTPLRTLNLSDNVVDAKAALILAQALGSNSNLRELDLRQNRLGDAGIAVLVEPFIS
jgi:Ran GTPase-activating protein (RanGAP) involved in mRNA processing and transport